MTTTKRCRCGCGKAVRSRSGYVKYHNRPDIYKPVCKRGHIKQRSSSGDLRCKLCSAARMRAKKYNITVEEALVIPKRCQACKKKSYKLQVDHCHDTNEFRGWLCRGCNSALGWMEDDPQRIVMVLDYLLNWVERVNCSPNSPHDMMVVNRPRSIS
jgi:Recombination endonuclease VII